MPPNSARTFFGISPRPIDEYFQPVVPSMAGRLSAQEADANWLAFQRRIAADQLAQQQAQLEQQEFNRRQAANQRSAYDRFQQILGADAEEAAIQQFQNQFAQQQEQNAAMQQRDAVMSAMRGIDPRTNEGRAATSRILADNPLAAMDSDVGRYLQYRGYDPRDKEAYRRDEWLASLPTEYRLKAEGMLAGNQTLSAAQSAIENESRNQKLKSALLRAGIPRNELPAYQNQQGNFDQDAIDEKIGQLELQKRSAVESRKAQDEIGNLMDTYYEAVDKGLSDEYLQNIEDRINSTAASYGIKERFEPNKKKTSSGTPTKSDVKAADRATELRKKYGY